MVKFPTTPLYDVNTYIATIKPLILFSKCVLILLPNAVVR